MRITFFFLKSPLIRGRGVRNTKIRTFNPPYPPYQRGMRKSCCFIVCIVSLITLLVYASEEGIFRDELHSDTKDPDVSIEEYQRDLAKLLQPHRTWDLKFKAHHLPNCCDCTYNHRNFLY